MNAAAEDMSVSNRPSAPGGDHDRSKRAFFGTIALSGVNSARLALQLVVLPILARILGPAAYGLVALAMPFILFANMLADAGMGNALIQRQDPTADEEATVFWVTVSVGAIIALTICAGSGAVAQLMHQPKLAPVMLALSPILILSSSLSVPNSRISRARHFGLFAVSDFLSAIMSSGAAILAALNGYGAWSLVIQQLVLWLAKACWVIPASGFRPRLVCRLSLAKPFLAFGLNNVAADISNFIGKSAPALIIGGQLGVIAVGHYSMAYQLVRIPDWILSGPLYLATFTAVAAVANRSNLAAQLSIRTIRMVLTVMAPLFVGLALVADLLMAVFLGPKWMASAPVLAILAGGGLCLSLYAVCGAVLMGLGRSDLQFRLSAACGACMVVGVLIGARFGLATAALGMSAGAALASPLYVVAVGKELSGGPKAILAAIAWPLIATMVMTAAVFLVRRELAGRDPAIQLAGAILTGAIAFLAALAVTSGRQLLDDVKQILPTRRRVQQELT